MSSYDQNLLDEAPRATRAQLQEGYNVDLLEQPPRRTPSVRNPPPQISQPMPLAVPLTPGIVESGSGEKIGSSAYTSAVPKSRTSFWRSRNGVIAVVLIVLIVVGAVVGGAVGGTVKKSSNNNVGTTGTGSVSSSASSLPSVSISTSATESVTQGIAASTSRPVRPTTTSTSVPASTQSGQNTGREVIAY